MMLDWYLGCLFLSLADITDHSDAPLNDISSLVTVTTSITGAYHHKNYQFWLEWCKPITCCWTPRGSKALEARRHVMGLGMVLTRLDIVLRKYEWKYISAGGFIPGMHFFVIPPAGVFIFSVGQLYFSCAWQLAEMSQLLEVCQLMKCENSGQLAELSKSVVLCASWWIGKVAANWQNWGKTFYSYLQGRSF